MTAKKMRDAKPSRDVLSELSELHPQRREGSPADAARNDTSKTMEKYRRELREALSKIPLHA